MHSPLSALLAQTTPSQCHMGDFVSLPILYIGIPEYFAQLQFDAAIGTEQNGMPLNKQINLKLGDFNDIEKHTRSPPRGRRGYKE